MILNRSVSFGRTGLVKGPTRSAWLGVFLAAMMLWPAGNAAAVVLARVGGEPITDTNVFALAASRTLLRGIPYQDPAMVHTLVEDIILDRLVTLEARDVDVSRAYDYRTRAMIDLTDLALRIQAAEVALPSLTIDSALIDSFYHANIARYTVPRPQRWVRQITVYKPGHGIPEQYGKRVDSLYEGWDCKRKIDSIYTRLINGENFPDLAWMHSEDMMARDSRGDLGWISEATVHEPVIRDWMMSLPPYLISQPFESDFGWHIAQVRAVRDAGPAPIDPLIESDIRMNLLVELGKKLGESVRDSLFGAATIEYNEAALASDDSGIAPGTVIAVVNQRDTLWGAAYFIQKNSRSDTRLAVLDTEQKRSLIRPLLQHLCLSQWISSQGYFDRTEVIATAEKLRLQAAREIVAARFNTIEAEIDSAELRTYYSSHITEFTPTRRHLIQKHTLASKGEADSIAAQWKAGNIDIAETQWIGPDDVPRNIWNRIAAVPAGTVLEPLAIEAGFQVIRLEQIAPPKPFDQARHAIANTLRERKRNRLREAFVREAASRHGVQRFPERINAVGFPTYGEFESALNADSTLSQSVPGE